VLLNDVQNVEFREGNWFEPVAGEEFDLVVSNPPFVVSPDSDFLYRDSAGPGDEISRDTLQGAADHLAPGGTATVLVGWVQDGTSPPWVRPTDWAADTGCDVWVLHHSSHAGLSYAVQWNSHLRGDPDLYLGTVARWVEHYREHGIGAVGYGAVVLRKREPAGVRPWRRFDDLSARHPDPSGDVLASIAAVEDRLAGSGGAQAMLDERLVVNEQHVIDQTLRPRAGTYEVERAELAQDGGLHFRVPTDPMTVELMARCDGRRTLREAIGVLRDEVQFGPGTEAEFDAAASTAALTMLRLGFLRLPD
jgi:hypothetical protein